MKEFGYEKITTTMVKKAICDECGSDCTASYFDLLIKPSFSETSVLLKTVCWKCYEKIKEKRNVTVK